MDGWMDGYVRVYVQVDRDRPGGGWMMCRGGSRSIQK